MSIQIKSVFLASVAALLMAGTDAIAQATDLYAPPIVGLRVQTLSGTFVRSTLLDVGLRKPVLSIVLRLSDGTEKTVMLAFPLFYQGDIFPCVIRESDTPPSECNSNDTVSHTFVLLPGKYVVSIIPMPVPDNPNGIATNWITRV